MTWRLVAGGWWDRLRGRLEPRPYPFAEATLLDSPLRTLFLDPARVLAAFDVKPGQRVLEIGSGTGYYSLEGVRRIGDRGRLTCLDIQREMLLETRRRLCAADFEGAALIQASAEDLPFAANSFDHVLAVTVLGEIPNRSQALREIRRVLRPAGRLSVSEQLPDPDFITPGSLRHELRASGFAEESTRRHFLLAYTSTWHAAV
jgi:ubiquinone/menaquinone biosynthesis C-methylase UbiE